MRCTTTGVMTEGVQSSFISAAFFQLLGTSPVEQSLQPGPVLFVSLSRTSMHTIMQHAGDIAAVRVGNRPW